MTRFQYNNINLLLTNCDYLLIKFGALPDLGGSESKYTKILYPLKTWQNIFWQQKVSSSYSKNY